MIQHFLLKNGFTEVEKNIDVYTNGKCKVNIFYDCIEITSKENGERVYSDDHNIYWLIGYLTYYNLMDKNYNQ